MLVRKSRVGFAKFASYTRRGRSKMLADAGSIPAGSTMPLSGGREIEGTRFPLFLHQRSARVLPNFWCWRCRNEQEEVEESSTPPWLAMEAFSLV